MLLSLALMFAFQTPPAAAVVTKPVANMYSSATEQADVVSQAIYGRPLALLEEKDGWAQVRTEDEYTGWMPANSFRRLAAGEQPYASKGRVAMVEAMFANVYREPDVTKHAPLLVLPYETKLEVAAERDDRWFQVKLVDGAAAWVQRGDLTFDTAPMPIEAMIAFSKRFLGLPYLWGGTSTFGYDCSGFMQMLMRRRGVLMPRDAQPQADWNRFVPVATKDLEPGDLLYFGRNDKHITHTGMYIGNGQFINATTHEKPIVQICPLGDPYWTKLLVAARRLK
jgi:cell wall-associated NlpC family hydrolase